MRGSNKAFFFIFILLTLTLSSRRGSFFLNLMGVMPRIRPSQPKLKNFHRENLICRVSNNYLQITLEML